MCTDYTVSIFLFYYLQGNEYIEMMENDDDNIYPAPAFVN